MAQDPWKRAYQMQQLKQAGTPVPTAGPPGRRPRRTVFWWRLLIALLLLGGVATLSIWAWRQREVLLPELHEELPAPVREHLPQPSAKLDQFALQDGLGIQLAIFGDYNALVAATRERGVDWQLTTLSQGRVRLSAPGVKVYAGAYGIESYVLDVPQVYAAPEWRPWLPELRKAGVHPELTWGMLSGDKEPPPPLKQWQAANSQAVQLGKEWARQAFILRFEQGKLRLLEGCTSFGAYAPPGEYTDLQPEVEPDWKNYPVPEGGLPGGLGSQPKQPPMAPPAPVQPQPEH